MEIKYFERTAAQSDDDVLEYVMSDSSVDRMGDIIEADGWDLKHFKQNPVALYAHDRKGMPIGKWEKVRIEGGRLIGRLKLADAGTSEFHDTVRKLVEQRLLRAVSVGFSPKEYVPLSEKEPYGPYRFLKQELHECSLCAVPANANALQIMRSLPDAVRERLLAKSGNGITPESRGLPAKSGVTPPSDGLTKMSLSERIQTKQDELIALCDRQAPLLAKVNDGADLGTEEQTEFDTIEGEKVILQKSLDTLRATERALAGQATRPNGSTPNLPAPAIHGINRAISERGIIVEGKPRAADLLVRMGVVHLRSFAQRKPFEQVRQETYPDRPEVDAVIKAATNPALTTVAGWAAELVDTAILDFLEALTPLSVYAQLRTMGIRFSFGRNGVIKIPRRNRPRNAPGDLRGAFVGEGAPIPVRRGSFGSISLTPHKMGVISTFSREMANQSTPQIEGLIREAIVEDTAEAIDQALLDAIAGDTIRPAGLLNGVSTTPASAAATSVDKITADMAAALAPFITANAADRLVWLINPSNAFKMQWASTTVGVYPFRDQIAAGNIAGLPVIQSTMVPTTSLILVRYADFVSSVADTPEFDISDVASIHEDDGGYPTDQAMRAGTATVLPLVDAAGVAAKPVRSLWQTASIGVRMLLDMDWAMRRASMVTHVSPLAW
jgi:HK97 family phage major capsid protein/HK97 family phage prohead protease